MRNRLCIPLLFILCLSAFGVVHAETLTFDDQPLKFAIGDEERLIRFDSPVDVRSSDEKLVITNVGRTLLIKAKKGFTQSRLFVRARTDGQIAIIDVARSDQASGDDVIIEGFPTVLPTQTELKEDLRVVLTRYAAQYYYAPDHAFKALPGIRPIRVEQKQLNHVYRGAKLQFTPLKSWAYQGYFVTAIRVQNTLNEEVIFDPRLLRLNLITATAQHGVLGPVSTERDQTMLYVITDRSFREIRNEQ